MKPKAMELLNKSEEKAELLILTAKKKLDRANDEFLALEQKEEYFRGLTFESHGETRLWYKARHENTLVELQEVFSRYKEIHKAYTYGVDVLEEIRQDKEALVKKYTIEEDQLCLDSNFAREGDEAIKETTMLMEDNHVFEVTTLPCSICLTNEVIPENDSIIIEIEKEAPIEEVVQVEDHLVELEITDPFLAPIDLHIYERVWLLEYLPRSFSAGRRFRSWNYSRPHHEKKERTSLLVHKLLPTLYREYTHVRGWSIEDLKNPRQFKANQVLKVSFSLGSCRLRSYTGLKVYK